ncbi:ph-response sensor protein [Emmonsiellopsis sp. PD_33]|nr:ph-response sensor protein [Emmonsiellopsis sp. PD_33]
MSFDPPNPSPTPSARNRSIISKFTNRFSNRTRNISEFYIQLSEPYKTYFPGDAVKGSVVLKVVKPVRITHLVLCLHGYVKVFKNPLAPGEGLEESGFLGPGRGRRNGAYLGNGFASLFEDEIVLCGDGRITEGIYKFEFEMEFPPYRLPSSITFERGTISYMLTSTLTRPTTISPTMSCDKRITLLETIDVAPLPAPKPRIISLEPVLRKAKARPKTKRASKDQISSSGTEPTPGGGEHRPPLSPVPSELSNSSCMSNSTQSFQVVSEPNSTLSHGADNEDTHSTARAAVDKTIRATVELTRSGGVPGDVLPVKITIQHSKPIRSPNGVIITLYRQGRIDIHPAIPVGATEKGKKPVYEDYYPKSRTGLGGLSFGATRSSSTFRKDLSQIFAPLIVDPVTMTATVKTSIRIPEDVFPTITHVPGSMISFRYYAEVVMDLRGKLAGQDRFIPRLNMMTGSSSYNYSPSGQVLSFGEGRSEITSPWAGNILDTDQVRREKSVVACVFEVIIGTKDSGKGQQQTSDEPAVVDDNTPHPVQHGGSEWDHHYQYSQTHQYDETDPSYENGYDNDYGNGYHTDEPNTWQDHPPHSSYPPFHPTQFIPPAHPEEVDEKTRLRRAEEMLLPSAPSHEDAAEAGPSAAVSEGAPSAPILSEQENILDPPSINFNPRHPDSNSLASAPSVDTITPAPRPTTDLPPSPHSSPSRSHGPRSYKPPQEDKQELERQRLLAQASAPNTQHHSMDENMLSPHPEESRLGATAPMLTEEDLTQPSATPESLPRYQR